MLVAIGHQTGDPAPAQCAPPLRARPRPSLQRTLGDKPVGSSVNILPCSPGSRSRRDPLRALVPAVPRITEMMGILPEQAASRASRPSPRRGDPSSTRWPCRPMAMIGRIVQLARSIVDESQACISPMLPSKTPAPARSGRRASRLSGRARHDRPRRDGSRFMVPSVDLCLT